MNPQFNEIGSQFAAHYYSTFDADRTQLATMYNEASIFTYGGSQLMGQVPIMTHITQVRSSLPGAGLAVSRMLDPES